MKINELMMSVHNKDFNLEKRLEVKKYLPIEAKKAIAQSIIYDCTSEESGITKVDSVERYMSYVRHMITTHTNLEYTDEDYDKLCSAEYAETTLLNAIMGCFDADAKECTRILNLMTDDLIYANSIEVAVGKFLYNINNSLSGLTEGLAGKLNAFDIANILPKDINTEQFANILNMINTK